jgi:preprotein translocase subunit SecF
MRFFAGGKIYDFMRWSKPAIVLSVFLVLGSLGLLLFGNPKLGTDFRGGTEVEVAFSAPTTPQEVRGAVTAAGFGTPDVIKVDDAKNPFRYLVRVHEVSTISEVTRNAVERALCYAANVPAAECPEEKRATEVKFSPGGDKVTARFTATPDLPWVRERMAKVPGLELRPGESNPSIQNARDHKVEVQLMSKGDQLVGGLKRALGAKAPEHALRAEWIGPRAGAQLRDSAVKSIVIAIVFIMAYIAFRFDLRFAPGSIIALIHDATATIGVLILMGRELDLTTVAAVLTIIGYSVNDTVVIYDRVRENLGKLRGASFHQLINVSLSEMLGRTILTTFTVQLSLLAFFFWGTGTLKHFALTLTIGLLFGTYSTMYIALPVTELLDKALFSRIGKKGGPGGKSGAKPRGERLKAEPVPAD